MSALDPRQLEDVMARLAAGDARTLARAVSLVENGEARGIALLECVYARAPHPWVIGFTGVGGAGKSTPLVKAATLNENFGSAALMYSVGEKVWQRLSPEQRRIMTEVGQRVTFEACVKIDEGVAKDYEKMRAAGISVAQMGAADRSLMQAAADAVGAEWAQGLDRRGKPASEVLKAFREATR